MESIAKLNSPDEIAAAWKQLEETKNGIRIREAAQILGLSEGQLLATTVGTEAKRLKNDWKMLLERLPSLGRIMSLTRNDACVLEHKGAFEKVNVFGKDDHRMATVIGPIETRVFLKSWYAAFAVHQVKGDRELTSIQVFDHAGDAVTKIYLQEDSDRDAYQQLVFDMLDSDQSRDFEVQSYDVPEFSTDIDKAAFLDKWANLKDTHDFFPMLKNFNVHRHHAVELAQGRFSHPLDIERIQEMLEKAAKQKLPIMIFAGNRGNLQIHQDKVKTIRMLERGGEQRWLNVLDPDFNMHLRVDLLETAYVVTKPTKDGDVTSIECFDKNKDLVVQFFGLRKPGIPELTEWKELVDQLGNVTIE